MSRRAKIAPTPTAELRDRAHLCLGLEEEGGSAFLRRRLLGSPPAFPPSTSASTGWRRDRGEGVVGPGGEGQPLTASTPPPTFDSARRIGGHLRHRGRLLLWTDPALDGSRGEGGGECWGRRARSEPTGPSALDDRLGRMEADRGEGVVGPGGEGDPLRAGA
ncbi:MAG: hypothetical protein J5I35_11415 [Methanothrix harundinacea]|nr:hypothetical protein [Methanothrix harundinacea]